MSLFLLFFLSLRDNKISNDGAHALSGALNVNQSLQKLEWVQHFMTYVLTHSM